MRNIFLLLSFMCVSHLIHGKLSPEEHAKIEQFQLDCIGSTGVDKTIVEKSKKGEFPDDANFKEWVFCLGKKAEYLLEDGSYNAEVMRATTAKGFDEEKGELLVSKCGNKSFGNGPENAYQLVKCFYENTQMSLY